ncbi:uncharacterized protein JN550_005613 [Neoarthrinium moseri]|uniref:uncharacterized protein n=1 Tax=Neoarthrinium moseri TaxID=1658444 RepID=UPI001FDCA65C|nr:uncharacterized protein JN550_005613 [Neoarthrinium moseri]KAI1869632.1 hypothetical protein JN550_005613 [Neoarthrinium moseri]
MAQLYQEDPEDTTMSEGSDLEELVSPHFKETTQQQQWRERKKKLEVELLTEEVNLQYDTQRERSGQHADYARLYDHVYEEWHGKGKFQGTTGLRTIRLESYRKAHEAFGAPRLDNAQHQHVRLTEGYKLWKQWMDEQVHPIPAPNRDQENMGKGESSVTLQRQDARDYRPEARRALSTTSITMTPQDEAAYKEASERREKRRNTRKDRKSKNDSDRL